MLSDSDREHFETIAKAKVGSLILHRLVPAPDHGAGFRRDPETGFVYYSSEWLDDERPVADPWRTPGDAIGRLRASHHDATLRCPTCNRRADMCFEHGDDWKKRQSGAKAP